MRYIKLSSMKYILAVLLTFFSVCAFGQGSPTGAKTQFKNGVAVGSKDSSAYGANDSLFLTIDRNNKLMWRGNGANAAWRIVSQVGGNDFIRNQTGSNLSAQTAKFDISDTARSRGVVRGGSVYADGLLTGVSGAFLATGDGIITNPSTSGRGGVVNFKQGTTHVTSGSGFTSVYGKGNDTLGISFYRSLAAANAFLISTNISEGASRYYNLQDASGTLALTSNVTDSSAALRASINTKLNISDTAAMKATITLDRVLQAGNSSGRDATVGGFTATTGYFSSNLTSAAKIRSDKAFFNSSSTGATDTVVSVVSAASGPAMVVQNSNGQAIRAQGAVTITSTGTGSLNNALDLVSSSGQRFIRANNGSSNVFTVDNGGEVAATSVVLSGNLTGTTVNLSGAFNSSVSTNADFPNIIANTSSGTSAFSTMYISNDGSSAGALTFGAVGTGNTTGGIFPQDGAVLYSGTSLSGGLSFGTRANAAAKIYTNATLAMTWNTDQTTTLSSLGTGTVYSNSGTLTNVDPSDIRIKNTIQTHKYGLSEILRLKPKTFYYNSDTLKSSLKYGFIAQDVKEIMPDMVRPVTKDSDTLGLESQGIYVTMVKAIQEQQDQIKALEARIAKLEAILNVQVRKTRR